MAENEWFSEDDLIYIRNREKMLLGDYKKAKERLEWDKSEISYKDMIEACYWLTQAWGSMGGQDNLQGVIQEYEKTVLEYWKQYQTTESLCHVLYFYCDADIASYTADMAEEHVKKGIPYAELYHGREDKDYSACIYVDIYLKLYWIFGEMDEQLGYVEKAWSLAREYARKYRTLQMLEKYQQTVEAFAIYHGLCPQDIDEEEVAEKEREFEEFSAAVEGTLVLDVQKHQKEMFCSREVLKVYGSDSYGTVEMPFILSIAGGRIAKTAEYVMKEQHDEMEKVCGIIKAVLNKAEEKGVLALEECLGDIKESKAPLADFLADYILRIADGIDRSLILKMMTNEFILRKPDDFETLVLFSYIAAVISVRERLRYRIVIYREEAWRALAGIKDKYVVFLPKECRKAFEF